MELNQASPFCFSHPYYITYMNYSVKLIMPDPYCTNKFISIS